MLGLGSPSLFGLPVFRPRNGGFALGGIDAQQDEIGLSPHDIGDASFPALTTAGAVDADISARQGGGFLELVFGHLDSLPRLQHVELAGEFFEIDVKRDDSAVFQIDEHVLSHPATSIGDDLLMFGPQFLNEASNN